MAKWHWEKIAVIIGEIISALKITHPQVFIDNGEYLYRTQYWYLVKAHILLILAWTVHLPIYSIQLHFFQENSTISIE